METKHGDKGEPGYERMHPDNHPLRAVLQAVWKANGQTNARARASATKKAYRLLAESGWDGYEGEHLSLHHYAQLLDAEVWGGAR